MKFSLGIKGYDGDEEKKEINWVNLKNGDTVTMVLLAHQNEMMHGNRYEDWTGSKVIFWVEQEENDPADDLGEYFKKKTSKHRGFLPVAVKDGKEWVFGWFVCNYIVWKGIQKQVFDEDVIEVSKNQGIDEDDVAFGLVIKVERESNRDWYVNSMGVHNLEVTEQLYVPQEELVENLGPKDRESVIKLIESRTGKSFDEYIEYWRNLENDDPDNDKVEPNDNNNNNNDDEEVTVDNLF